MASNTSSTSVQVNWGEVPFPDQLGIIRGYRVLMWRSNQSSDILRNATVLVPLRAISFSRLEMYTNYTIQLLAFTVKGEGNKSEPIAVITDEDGKLMFFFLNLRWCIVYCKKIMHALLLGCPSSKTASRRTKRNVSEYGSALRYWKKGIPTFFCLPRLKIYC